MGDRVYFVHFDQTIGEELWMTDGTIAGTRVVADYLPAAISTLPSGLTALGRRLLFKGQTPPSGGFEPYVTDGTIAGTGVLLDLYPGAPGSQPGPYAVLGEYAVFLADDGVHGPEFYRTDGTVAGTSLVTDLIPGPAGIPGFFSGVAGGRAFYTAGFTLNVQLFATDGTAAGTARLFQWPQVLSSSPSDFVEVGGRVYFIVPFYGGIGLPGNNEMWSTDGTPAGTRSHGGVTATRLRSLGSRLLVERITPAEGAEPWIFDPATNAYSLVQNFAPFQASSRIEQVAVMRNGRALLTRAPTGSAVLELWSFDPSAASPPVLLRTQVESLMPVGDRYVYFTGEDNGNGHELWRTDGTVCQRFGGESFVGPEGLLMYSHFLSGGRLLLFANRSNGICAPQLFAIEPDAHTMPLGEPGAAGAGLARLSGDDPVLGTTADLRLDDLGPVLAHGVVLDSFSTHPLWFPPVWFYSGANAPIILTIAVTAPGTNVVPLAVPASPVFAGLRVVAQGFGLFAQELRATNGLLLTGGY